MNEYERKVSFIENELRAMMKKVNDYIVDVLPMTRMWNDEQIVTHVCIVYENGARKNICVEADSLGAIVVDVMKCVY